MEAMAMRLPVISTNWSGLTAFLKEEVRGREGGGRWVNQRRG